MSGTHVIGRQVFEFHIPDEGAFRDVADRISGLAEKDLPEALDRALSALVPDDLHLRIDRLEIDVGRLQPADIGETLVRRIAAAVAEQVEALRRQPPDAPDRPGATRDLQLVNHFLRHGRLPWWAPQDSDTVRQTLSNLLEADPARLRPVFEAVRPDPDRLGRLLRHLDPQRLLRTWKAHHPRWKDLPDDLLRRAYSLARRRAVSALGPETARDALHYHLLRDLLGTDTPAPFPLDPLNPVLRPSPFPAVTPADGRYPGGGPGTPPTPGAPGRRSTGNRFPTDRAAPEDARTRRPGTPGKHSPSTADLLRSDLSGFGTFLRSGRLDTPRSGSRILEIVRLFRRLMADSLPDLERVVRDLGRSGQVRRRILDNIASPDLRAFFARAVPDKKDLFDWVRNVYLETQKKVRPINQTNIRVQRSVDEITLEIYTSTDLNAISNATFLRMHLRRMALRHHLRYEDLLRRIIDSVAAPPLPTPSRFIDLLRQIYAEDVAAVKPPPAPPADGRLAEAVAAAYRLARPADIADEAALRAHVQRIAQDRGMAFTDLLQGLLDSIDTPVLPLPDRFFTLLRRIRSGREILARTPPAAGRLAEAVTAAYRLVRPADIADEAALRAHVQRIAQDRGMAFTDLLQGLLDSIDTPALPLPDRFFTLLRRIRSERAVPPVAIALPTTPPDKGRLAEAVAAAFRLAGTADSTDDDTLRADLRRIAVDYRMGFEDLLQALFDAVADPPLPLPSGFPGRLERIRSGSPAKPRPSPSAPAAARLAEAVAAAFRLAGTADSTDDDTLRADLRRIAVDYRMGFEDLLQALFDAVADPPLPLPSGFPGRLERIRSGSPAEPRPSPSAPAAARLAEAVAAAYRFATPADTADEASLRRWLGRIADRSGVAYDDLMGRIFETLGSPPVPLTPRLATLLQHLARHDLSVHPAGSRPGTSDRPPVIRPGDAGQATVPPTPLPPLEGGRGEAPAMSGKRLSGEEVADPGDGVGAMPPPVDPVPPELLRLLTREVVRTLILAKGTGIFGQATRTLQELISAYIRLRLSPPDPDSTAMSELPRRLADYLDLEPGFLAFALRHAVGQHPADAGLRSTAAGMTGAPLPPSATDGVGEGTSAGEVLALLDHLTAHRVYYEAAHVRALLLPALRRVAVDRRIFLATLRLLFDEEAGLVDATLHRLIDRAIAPSGIPAPEALREDLYRSFIGEVLGARGRPVSLNRVFASVRRRLQPGVEGPFVLPARLSDLQGYFMRREPSAAPRGPGRKALMLRENAIIRLYGILDLDLVLTDVGARFFDNIPFSFELLLTRYRQAFLGILHTRRFDPALAQFFAYADGHRLFEQVRALYPRSRTERVLKVFGHVADLIHRGRWLRMGREEAEAFVRLDAYPHIFSAEELDLQLSDIFNGILQRAASEGLLSGDFAKIFDDADDGEVVARLLRRMGRRRMERLLPGFFSLPAPERLPGLRSRLRLFRELLPETPREAAERDAYLTLSVILAEGRFPAGHPFEGQTPADQAGYLADRVGSGRLLARLLADAPPVASAAPLLDAMGRDRMLAALALRYGVDRTLAKDILRCWADRASGAGPTDTGLMRELLLQPGRGPVAKGAAALHDALLAHLAVTGAIGFWQVLDALREPEAPPGTPVASRAATVFLAQLPPGDGPWFELYFGVLSRDGSGAGYRTLQAWVGYLVAHPRGRTGRQLLVRLADALLQAGAGGPASTDALHAAFLEVFRPFDGRPYEEAATVFQALSRAGVPEAELLRHIAGQVTPDGYPLADLPRQARGQAPPLRRSAGRGSLRTLPTPAGLAAALMREGMTGRRGLAGLRRWVDARTWTPAESASLSDILPPRAWQALLRSLSPAADIDRILEAWVAVLGFTGLQPEARLARQQVTAALFQGRLWRYRTAAVIHAALSRALDLSAVVRPDARWPDADWLRRQGIPPALFAALRHPSDNASEGSGRISVDMASSTLGEEVPQYLAVLRGVGGDGVDGQGGAANRQEGSEGRPSAADAAMDFFLETGLLPGIAVADRGSEAYREMAGRVRQAGLPRFLSVRRLLPAHEERVLDFFEPAEVTRHIFGTLTRRADDAVLRDFLQVMGGEALRARVRLADLVRFLRLFRAHGTGRSARTGERFLGEALRIPAFFGLARRLAAAMPLEVLRRSRSPFVRRLLRDLLRERRRPVPDVAEVVSYYLRTGMLLPASGIPTPEALAERLQTRLRTGDALLRQMFFRRSRDVEGRRRVRRMLASLPEAGLYAFIHPALGEGLATIVRLMRQRFGIDVWRAVGARTDRDRMERVLQWWSQTRARPESPVRLLRLFMETVTAGLDERQLARVRQADTGRMTPAERELWLELRALVPGWLDAGPEADRKIRPVADEQPGEAMNDPDTPGDPAEGIPLRNGGLVILWPFLGRLFARLQLTDGKAFLGEAERSRAIRLTEYIVTGSPDMEEHQLALNKLLCGGPPDTPVPAGIDITPEEADLCLKMLQGAIRNWEKLKTTRPETFRHSFLQRNAMLYRIDDRWELVVQRKAYDMLLDTLPWNISMIQLSWMPDRLVVQWK